MSSQQQGYTEYQDPSLTQADIAAFKANRTRYFKGTIAVAVIYGVLAVLLFMLAALTERGREIITTDALPFTITFVIGVVLVIVALVVSVTTAKPIHVPRIVYDNAKCPDYWTLSPTEPSLLKQVQAINPQLVYAYSYKCTPPTSPNLNNPTTTTFNPTTSPTVSANMKAALNSIQGPAKNGSGALFCRTNYPQYLHLQDTQYKFGNADPSTNNHIRCQIAKSCGYSWTSACPSPPSSDL